MKMLMRIKKELATTLPAVKILLSKVQIQIVYSSVIKLSGSSVYYKIPQ